MNRIPSMMVVLALVLVPGTRAMAQEGNPPAGKAPAAGAEGQGQQAIEPPRSGLVPRRDEGTDTTDIVYPSRREVVEDTIKEAEDASFTTRDLNRLKRLELTRDRAKASPYITPAKPVTRTIPVNLDPGVQPRVIRLSRGLLTSIVFSDRAGNPWEIVGVRTNRQIFNDGHEGKQQDEGDRPDGNVLMLEPLTTAAYGNVSVTLKGLPTPVIFTLATGQKEVDVRIDAKIPGANPDAGDNVVMEGPPGIDDALTAFLDGVPPDTAQKMRVEGASDTEAWMYEGHMYVRTKGAAQYPVYMSAARSTNGISVYRYEQFYDSVTFTAGGRAITAFVEQTAADSHE